MISYVGDSESRSRGLGDRQRDNPKGSTIKGEARIPQSRYFTYATRLFFMLIPFTNSSMDYY